MSISRYHLASSLSVIAALVLSATVVHAQAGGTIVRPDPPTLDVGQGQLETINIVIENAQNAYGIDVRAKFDPNVIEVVDADPNKDGVQMTPGSFIKSDFIVRNIADNQQGTLQYVVTQVNPSLPANGNGTLLSLQVRGLTLGAHTPLTITFVEIADRLGKTLPVQMQSAEVMVVTPRPQTPTPIGSVAASGPNAIASAPIGSQPTSFPIATSDASFPYAEITVTPAAGPVAAIATAPPTAGSISDQTLLFIAAGGIVGAVVLLSVTVVIVKRRARRSRALNNKGVKLQWH